VALWTAEFQEIALLLFEEKGETKKKESNCQ
jgi:hypothetical protein